MDVPRKVKHRGRKTSQQEIRPCQIRIEPKLRFTQQHPMVNDELPSRIASGTIIVKPNIRRFTKTGFNSMMALLKTTSI